MATYSKTSPYSATGVVNNYLDILKFRNISKRPTDTYYEIDAFYHRRPDMMASDFYGDAGLWWVFSVRNPDIIKDPIFDFYAGQKIFVPTKANLMSELGL